MDAVEALNRLGGVADLAALRRLTSRGKVRRALAAGRIVRDARGRYALPTAKDGLRVANRMSAVLSHLSAAAYWGWELKWQPAEPWVTVPRNRKLSPDRRSGVNVTWADLRPDEVVDGIVTSRDRTLIDCIRFLPFDEALAVADSALRHRHITKARLVWLASQVTGKGARQARRVAAHASEKAANPFESVLRAIAIGVRGLAVEPQVPLIIAGKRVYPDLHDRRLGLVLEAESFEWHGERAKLGQDCVRFNEMVVAGLVVLRFSWEQVMLRPAYVEGCLRAIVAALAEPPRRANRADAARKSA